MSERKHYEFWLSNQVNDQGSRPNSAHGSGLSTPDPYYSSQPTVDPRFGDPTITDTRSGGRATPDQRRTTGPHHRPRSPVPQPTPYPSFSGQTTPYQQRTTDSHGGQPILEDASGGHPGSYYSSQPTVDPHFVDHPIADPRYSSQPTPNQQRFTDPYGAQRFPVPQPTAYSSFSGLPIPNQQSITGPYHGLSILEATSGHHPSLYYSGQSTFDPRFSGLSITAPRLSGQPTLYQQRITNSYGVQPILGATSSGQRAPVPQPAPYSRFSDQGTPNPHRIAGPYLGQPPLEATSGGHPAPYSWDQPINNGIYTITNVYHNLLVYLEDPNDYSPLRGHHRPENCSAQWHVKNYGNERYSIENVYHNRYANSGPRAGLKAFVEGHSKDQLWRIQATDTGEYTITTTDTRNLWMLPDGHPDTPVWLSDAHTDPRCWWAFGSVETMAPVDGKSISGSFMPDNRLLLAPSGGQPMPETAIAEFSSVIAGAPDLLQPLGAACRVLKVLIQTAETIGHVNEERKALIKRLNFHLATVENDIAKLEEDQNIDKTLPALNQDVRESLETYARELKETGELLSDNQPRSFSLANKVINIDRNKGVVADKTLKIDEAFEKYMAALHQFAANTVAQMQQQLAQFGQELQQGAHTAAEKWRPNRPNAYGIQHRECLQGTRKKTLSAISNWFDDENTEKWIFFFLDVAGSGKSTVAKHMTEKWKRENRLLARFFFSRDTTETMSTNSFCLTVAGAFAALDPTYKQHIEKFMKVPNVDLLPFEERFEGLVVGPLRAIGRRAILIIDALDECHHEQRDQLLQTLRNQHRSIPFLRVLATGRPERDIKRWAEEKFRFGYMNFMRLEENDKDVELYIKHTLQGLPIAQDRLYPVIRHAEGLFIWARIACDLLLDSDDIDGLLEELGKEVSLDYLYKVALEQSMPKEGASRRAMVLVLQMILAAREPLSIAELEMLSPKRGVVEKVVTRLSSVLLYQGREDPVRLLHTTFREFLTARSKADIFFIQPELGHHTLASGCLTLIGDPSKQNNPIRRKSEAIYERKEFSFEQDTN